MTNEKSQNGEYQTVKLTKSSMQSGDSCTLNACREEGGQKICHKVCKNTKEVPKQNPSYQISKDHPNLCLKDDPSFFSKSKQVLRTKYELKEKHVYKLCDKPLKQCSKQLKK